VGETRRRQSARTQDEPAETADGAADDVAAGCDLLLRMEEGEGGGDGCCVAGHACDGDGEGDETPYHAANGTNSSSSATTNACAAAASCLQHLYPLCIAASSRVTFAAEHGLSEPAIVKAGGGSGERDDVNHNAAAA
jgi:hypothetical protein